MNNRLGVAAVLVVCLVAGFAWAAGDPSTVGELDDTANRVASDTREKVDEIAEKVDKSEKAQEYSAGLLNSIYKLAEFLSFSAFHWAAFALMVAGVVSFALQLVLTKLILLMKMSFSITEVLSDGLGLAISLVGLVLTTQAAAENSSFTQSPAAVLSAAIAGAIAGFIFYIWGQGTEFQASKS